VKKYKTKILKMLHQMAVENFKIGAISEERMREYDRDCLVQDELAVPKAARAAKRALASASV
jgi:DNA-binding transcriptional regulator YiaG